MHELKQDKEEKNGVQDVYLRYCNYIKNYLMNATLSF